MVGDDAVARGLRRRAFLCAGLRCFLTDRLDQVLEQIDVVVVVTPCMSAAMRSSPMPVSIDGRGRSARAGRAPPAHIA